MGGTIIAFAGFYRLVFRIQALGQKRSKEVVKAVNELPQIKPDDPILVDPEDDSVMDCCICMESLACANQEAVQTHCSHFFHRDCLLIWAKGHTDCPLCRSELDPKGRNSSQSACEP